MPEYSIKGGEQGAKRLDILFNTLEGSTNEFLNRAELNQGIHCLDLGCGNGGVSFLLADLTGSEGQVLGLDIDQKNIQIANETASKKNIENISFQRFDAYELDNNNEYDLVYSRFLLSHLASPETVLNRIFDSLKTGGTILVEDTDFTGHFCYPNSAHFDQYVSLYQKLLKIRGGNANRGQELVGMLEKAGFTDIEFTISQPAHTSGNGKLMAEITFEAVFQSLIDEQLIDKKEFSEIHKGLIEFRKREDTLMSLPRIFQVKARRE
ncbi:MAG: class I SAM-dependent methyltransferase [Balneola sp.]|nr:MAG: class I SAM-dependent methyltransferase [Balneola sp.]